MILPLHLLGKDPHTLELSEDAGEAPKSPSSPQWAESGIVGKVGLHLDVTPLAGDSYLLRGKAFGTLDAECARCLERISQPFSVNFDVLLEQKSSQGLEWVDDEDQGVEDYQVRVGPDVTEIPLGDVIAEQVLLNYNLHPLPELDAAGRCTLCDRIPPALKAGEAGKADKAEEIDPRWAKLGTLKVGASRNGKPLGGEGPSGRK